MKNFEIFQFCLHLNKKISLNTIAVIEKLLEINFVSVRLTTYYIKSLNYSML